MKTSGIFIRNNNLFICNVLTSERYVGEEGGREKMRENNNKKKKKKSESKRRVETERKGRCRARKAVNFSKTTNVLRRT